MFVYGYTPIYFCACNVLVCIHVLYIYIYIVYVHVVYECMYLCMCFSLGNCLLAPSSSSVQFSLVSDFTWLMSDPSVRWMSAQVEQITTPRLTEANDGAA